MSVNIRYPNITALTEKEQLAQVKSFLHQLVDQLNYALPNMGSAGTPNTYEVQGGELSYYELRTLIIQETQELEELFGKLSQRMETDYVLKDGWTPGWHLAADQDGIVVSVDNEKDVADAVEKALEEAKESGEFDGPQGIQGPQGPQGIQGIQGIQGVQGEPGVGITFTKINDAGELVVTYSDGKEVNLGKVTGVDGQAGPAPVKGVDYFTEEEITAVATQAAGKIAFTLDEDGILYYEVITNENNNEAEVL